MSISTRRLQRSLHTESTPPSTDNPTADAGALPVGAAAYTIPAGAIFVSPGGSDTAGNGSVGNPYRTLTKGASMLSAGGTVVMRAGVYHEGGVGTAGVGGVEIYDNNATIQNYPGEAVWMDGSYQATNWTVEGSRWSTPFTTTFDHSPTWTRGADDSTVAYYGFINPDYPCAAWPEMVFVDGVQLRQVNSLAGVTASTFYVAGSHVGGTGSNKYDFNPTKIYIGINPAGHEIRIADLQTCLTPWSGASGITIRGIGIRRYATSMPQAACLKLACNGGLIENVHMEDIATMGIKVTNANCILRNVTAIRCGNGGMAAYQADDLLFDKVRAEYCNSEHFNYAPDCGGSKICALRRITVRNSIFSNNYAKGLWFDMSVDSPIVYNCDFINNEHYGIFYEISSNGISANNLVVGSPNNGLMVNNTNNMRIWNNTVVDCAGNSQATDSRPLGAYQDDRRPFPAGAVFGRDTRQNDSYYSSYMTWKITSLHIYNNVVAQPKSGTQGIFCIFDYENANSRTLSAYGAQMNGNVFHWGTQPTYPYIFPPATAGTSNPVVYFSHASMVSGTGLNANGTQISGTSPLDSNYRITAPNVGLHDKASGLPADIATLIGKPAGTKHVGCWR